MALKKPVTYLMLAFVIFVFIQSLFFKFAGHEETEIIFSTIAEWMKGVGLAAIAPFFAKFGGYAVGTVELIASILLLIPKTRRLGAAIALAVISGAIFFHLFTPLGVNRIIDSNGNTDNGALFFMACGVWFCSFALLFLSKNNNQQHL